MTWTRTGSWPGVLAVATAAAAACGQSRGDAAHDDDAGITAGAGGDDEGVPDGCEEPSVGPSPLRRLTRSQYDHTIRDLLGIDGNPSAALAPDEKVGQFFSNVKVPVGQLLAEQYMKLAEDLSAQADVDALAPCDPDDDAHACGAAFVDAFGLHAFRRPLADDERAGMIGVFEAGLADDGYATGIRLAIQAFLQSPQHLYQLELGLPPVDDAEVVELDQFELASRLSYFLWDSMPDDELLAAAQADELADPDVLRDQAMRMLDSPKAADAIASFHLQWLKLDALATLEKDATVYPGFDESMRAAMRDETARFADHVIRRDDGRLATLLTASYSFPTGPLFAIYGIDGQAGDPDDPIALDPSQRAGLLTQPSVLAVHAHANQSSPIRRGKLVRENLLCQPLAPPPPDVDVTPPQLDPNASTRERFEQHRTDPVCAGCHTLIDPIGFGFEHYDGAGAYRDQDAGAAVDASGEIVGSEDVDGEFDGTIELAQMLAGSEQVRECVAQQWFNYGFGRPKSDADSCSFDAMTAAFRDADYDVRELLVAIVATDAFRFRRTEAAGP